MMFLVFLIALFLMPYHLQDTNINLELRVFLRCLLCVFYLVYLLFSLALLIIW